MKNIGTIIWDLDNTLYKFTDNQIDGWNENAAHFVRDNGLDMDYEIARQLAVRGFTEHRNSTHFFVADHGFNARDIHVGVNKRICETSVIPCADTPELMRLLPPSTRHIILTYAIQDWAHRVLKYAKLDNFFDKTMIFGAEDYEFEDKAHSPRGINLALDKSGAAAENALFVEDTLANLKTAKAHTGVQTAYLHHDRPYNPSDMDFVDIIVRDTPELLRTLSAKKAA
jgi:FMN phosphatase YigB (HAD superfamily)